MDSSFMHYTPTARTDIAFNLALGTSLGGVKSIVVAGASDFSDNIELFKKTIFTHKVPFLILLYNDNETKRLPIKTFRLLDNYEGALKKANSFILKNKMPCALLIEDGGLE
jgi:hypothetical protein